MEKQFEDELIEVQGDLVSLALELAEGGNVERIFLYASIENENIAFNAFYTKGTQVIALSDLGKRREMVRAFLHMGTDDIERVISVCKQHGKPVPTEIKAVYDVGRRSLDTKYQYVPICAVGSGIAPGAVFLEWRELIKKSIRKVKV